MTETVLSVVGTMAIAMFGLLLFRIATGHWFCRYGREALLCAATFQLSFVVLRIMDTPLGLVSPEARTIIGGFMAVGFVAILTQIILIHRVVHRGGYREHTNLRPQTRC